jgi:hypothetical protein
MEGDDTGLIVMGLDYARLSVRKSGEGFVVALAVGKDAGRGAPETVIATTAAPGPMLYLRVQAGDGAQCRFSFSKDGVSFTPIGGVFVAKQGQWIGAKVGLFAVRSAPSRESGYADYDWFRVE